MDRWHLLFIYELHFIADKGKWPLHILPSSHRHTLELLPTLSSTYCSQRHWHFVDVMYSCLLPFISPCKAHVCCEVKKWLQRGAVDILAGGQRVDIKRMWHGGTVGPAHPRLWTLSGTAPVCVARKMSRKEGQNGDSATKQSVTLCAVVHPFHSSSPLSISLSPPFPFSNWCPQSCVSPHLPALKLHQPYLLLSLSMIIIIIIVIIVVIMVRIAVITCYF